MRMMLTKAKNDMYTCDNSITKMAYNNMIKNYEIKIMYLDSQKKK